MQTRFDAIIIGAGPAGSSTAILLARAGWSVALIEKQDFPRRKVCGECIAASNLPLLDALGIAEEFSALAGPPLRRVAIMAGRHRIDAALPAMDDRKYPWGRALGRERLDTLLLEQARKAGATVLQPWTAQAVGNALGAAECEAAAVGSSTRALLTAPVLIAAHGSWQAPPNQGQGWRAPPRPGDLFAFKANFRQADLVDGLLPVLAFPGGYGGMVVAEQGIATLACCIRRDCLLKARRGMPGLSAGEAVEAWIRRSTAGVSLALAHAQREGPWLGAGPIRPGIRVRHDGGLAFLAGNAAGEAHPIIGEGISMAMQSAWLLCERLLAPGKALASPQSLARIRRDYARAWRRSFARRIRLASVFAHLAMRPGLSPLLLPLLQRAPDALTHAARFSGKVSRPRVMHE